MRLQTSNGFCWETLSLSINHSCWFLVPCCQVFRQQDAARETGCHYLGLPTNRGRRRKWCEANDHGSWQNHSCEPSALNAAALKRTFFLTRQKRTETNHMLKPFICTASVVVFFCMFCSFCWICWLAGCLVTWSVRLLAGGTRLVSLVVPSALLEFCRGVLMAVFSSIIQKLGEQGWWICDQELTNWCECMRISNLSIWLYVYIYVYTYCIHAFADFHDTQMA